MEKVHDTRRYIARFVSVDEKPVQALLALVIIWACSPFHSMPEAKITTSTQRRRGRIIRSGRPSAGRTRLCSTTATLSLTIDGLLQIGFWLGCAVSSLILKRLSGTNIELKSLLFRASVQGRLQLVLKVLGILQAMFEWRLSIRAPHLCWSNLGRCWFLHGSRTLLLLHSNNG